MMQPRPSYEEYANRPIFDRLDDLNWFRLIATIPSVSSWSDPSFKREFADRIYEQLREVVHAAGFHYEHQLRPTVSDTSGVAVDYRDDRYDFKVFAEDETLMLERRGSKFSNFYEWYTQLMPSAGGIMHNMLDAVKELSKRKLDFTRVSYEFGFVLYDLQPDNGSRRVKNTELMGNIMKGFPGDDGRMSSAPEALANMARTDFIANRWIGPDDRRRLVRYKVEAPANLEWSSLWFTFGYGLESYTSPTTSKRSITNPEVVFTEYDAVLIEFLRDKAIHGFLSGMMNGYKFRTTPAALP